jgi:hypothetical protein
VILGISILRRLHNGEVTEWPIVQHWKCCVPQGTAGSNPALSAIKETTTYALRTNTFALPLNLASARSKLAGAAIGSAEPGAIACPEIKIATFP